MDMESLVASAPFSVIMTRDNGRESEIRCMTLATAERVKAEREARIPLHLPARDDGSFLVSVRIESRL